MGVVCNRTPYPCSSSTAAIIGILFSCFEILEIIETFEIITELATRMLLFGNIGTFESNREDWIISFKLME